jgi:hypothetical protein
MIRAKCDDRMNGFLKGRWFVTKALDAQRLNSARNTPL